MVKLLQHQRRKSSKLHKGLVRKFEGPFSVVKRIGKVAYRVALPPSMGIHPVFHVSLLKPFRADVEEPSRGIDHRGPTRYPPTPPKPIESILAHRVVPRAGVVPRHTEYLVKWAGLPDSETSWESEQQLWNQQVAIQRYRAEGLRTVPNLTGGGCDTIASQPGHHHRDGMTRPGPAAAPHTIPVL